MFKLVVAGLVAAFGSVLATAPSAPAPEAAPAVVIQEFGCSVYDAAGGLVLADKSMAVVTNRGNGMLSCRTQVDNPTGRAIRYNQDSDGKGCGTFAGVANKWTQTISASGMTNLVCHVNGNE